MTITKRDDRWYDERGNSWRTEESATTYSLTLINCRDCSNCNNCSNCINCNNCIGCSHCSSCINCYNCSDCSNCRNCISCSRCSGCSICKGCKQSIELDFKKNYKPQPIKSKKKNKIAKIRQEYNINDRRLEIEL